MQSTMKMNKILTDRQTFCNLAEWIVIFLATVICTFLSFLIFRNHFNDENSYPMRANILLHIVMVAIILGVGRLVGKLLNPHPKVCKWCSTILCITTLVYVGVFTFSYVSQTLLFPSADAKACYDIAIRFLNSEFGAVVPRDSYLSLWPYQTGLIFILEKMMRIFHTSDLLLFQEMNCLYLLLIIVSGYCIVCMRGRRMEGRIIYLLLMASYYPLLFSVSTVYGDLPGLAWIMVSMTCYMLYYKLDNNTLKYIAGIGFIVSTVLACIYKGNSLIYIVALLLITFVQQFRKLDVKIVVIVCLATILSISSTDITQRYYEYYAGNICGKGMPTTGWLAMGLQYNGEEAIPGGWNGFHSNTFIAVGYDHEESDKIFKESIKDSLKEFADRPGFACEFFYNKILKQWANQTHGTFWGMNASYNTSRSQDAYWVRYIENTQYRELLNFMDYHESIIYGIILIACFTLFVRRLKGQKIEWMYLLPITTFIGGFLFSLIWEGQTDVVMMYPIMMLPIAVSIWSERE